MRALRTLIGYHASFLKTMMVTGAHVDANTDSDEQGRKIDALVAVVVVRCGVTHSVLS